MKGSSEFNTNSPAKQIRPLHSMGKASPSSRHLPAYHVGELKYVGPTFPTHWKTLHNQRESLMNLFFDMRIF